MADLFSEYAPKKQIIIEGVTLLKGFALNPDLIPLIHRLSQASPFRHMMTPMGHAMKVGTTNLGLFGWISDAQGYRYSKADPINQQPWPDMPVEFMDLAQNAAKEADIHNFAPDCCLINRYKIGIGMGRHQDKDESDFNWPIVSVSLGLTATFQIFGEKRNGAPIDLVLNHGDVLVLSGSARLFYHGVKPLKIDPLQPALDTRFNLTFRRSQG